MRMALISPNPYHALFVANPQPMWVYDLETLRFLDVNDAALAKYGYARDEFLGLELTDIRPSDDADRVGADVQRHRETPLVRSGPWRHRLRNGHEIEVEITSQLMAFEGRAACLVGVHDVSAERALAKQLRHYALHDPLTGLANRQHLTMQVHEALQLPVDALDRCALLIADIEGVATVNEELGRDAGDQLLIAVAGRLLQARGDRAKVSRIGGTTFGLLFIGVADADLVRADAGELIAAISRPFYISGHEVGVSVRIGISVSEAGWSADDLIRGADAALGSLKDRRGPRLAIFNADPDVLHHVLRSKRLALERELRRAVNEDQLRLYYQPILDLHQDKISGVEALVRWVHPDRGLVAPNDFIPIAEHAGIVSEIDGWVMATACRQIRAWRQDGLSALSISVNVSGHDLNMAPQLASLIEAELQRNRIQPSLLEIELTESSALRNHDQVKRILGEVRALGVGIAIDDFGTGYSMLDRVRDLSVDRIKIDRTFVERLPLEGGALVAAMITMAHSLHLQVVAEGVQTNEQLKFLREHDCDYAQGYLIGRPTSAAEIARLVAVGGRFPPASSASRLFRLAPSAA